MLVCKNLNLHNDKTNIFSVNKYLMLMLHAGAKRLWLWSEPSFELLGMEPGPQCVATQQPLQHLLIHIQPEL